MLPGGEAEEREREPKRMLPGLKCGCCLKSSSKSHFSHFPPFPSVTFVVFAALRLHKHAYPHTYTRTQMFCFILAIFGRKKTKVIKPTGMNGFRYLFALFII